MVLKLHKVIHILTNKLHEQMFEKSFYLDSPCAIIIARDFEQVFLQSGGCTYGFQTKNYRACRKLL